MKLLELVRHTARVKHHYRGLSSLRIFRFVTAPFGSSCFPAAAVKPEAELRRHEVTKQELRNQV